MFNFSKILSPQKKGFETQSRTKMKSGISFNFG